MEYLNENEFKELDKFIETCDDTSAAIGDLQTVVDAIDGVHAIPTRTQVVYVGNLSNDGEVNLKDYEDMISMGIDLNEEELSQYHELLAAYEEMQNNSK